ncbi:hypothetical protein JCM9279_005368 [Rhodotorula babjevae]
MPVWGSPPSTFAQAERARGRGQEDRAQGGGHGDDGRRRSTQGWGQVPLGARPPQAFFKLPQAGAPSTSTSVPVHQLPNPPAARSTSPSRFASPTTRPPATLPTTVPHTPPISMAQDAVDLAPRFVPAMPDVCAVCGAHDTPEWRKGPAGYRSLCNGCGIVYARRLKIDEASGVGRARTVEEIERELVDIGLERFKKGKHRLPSGTRERILVTQERTRWPPAAQRPLRPLQKPRKGSQSSKTASTAHETEQAHGPSSTAASSQQTARKGSTKLERTALGVLLDFRRTSTSSTSLAHYRSSIAPCSPPAATPRGRRSGSGEESYFPSNVGSGGGTGLPPSSSYMLPLGGVGPSSTFSFGRTPSPPPPSAKSVVTSTSALERMSIDVSPSKEAPSLFYKPSPMPSGLVCPASPGGPSFVDDPTARRMSELAASTNRMSIAYLTASCARTPPSSSPLPPQARALPPPQRSSSTSTTSTSTSSARPAPSPVPWEAPPSVETRLERATSALRRRSSTIVAVKSPRLAAATPPRATSPSLSRRPTS